MKKAILIIDMPDNCQSCDFSEYREDFDWGCGDYCSVSGVQCSNVKRPDICPLKEYIGQQETHKENKNNRERDKIFCYSWDNEYYTGGFDTEEDAIKDAIKNVESVKPEESAVYIGTESEIELTWSSNEEEIINSIIDSLEDEGVEDAEDSLDINKSAELDLARMIDESVKKWIKKHNIKSSHFKVLDGHKVKI